MLKIGRYNKLRVVKELDFGVYLDGLQEGEILLPRRYVPEDLQIDDEINVFIYFDSEDRIIATTEHPLAQVGDFAMLEVKSTNRFGAFLDWGLMKDLLVPFREQKQTMQEGYSYLVHVYLDDESKRIAASAKIDKFLDNVPAVYGRNQEVDLIVAQETQLGYKAIINNQHWGMIYHNQIFQPIYKGDKVKGYIKEIRPDGKIDLILQSMGYDKIELLAKLILEDLRENDGYQPVSDKSSAFEIENLYSCSKKSFKQAIGKLYKENRILILQNGIKLIDENAGLK